MLQAEGTGKNIEKAIENALLELKAPREDVDIKILNEGGLFKKAKVLVSISEDVKEKYISKTKKKNTEKNESIEKSDLQTKTEDLKKQEEIHEEKVEEKESKLSKKQKEEKFVEPQSFLEGFFKSIEKEVTIEKRENEESIIYFVDGENLSDFIGRRGECLYAISNIMKILSPKANKRIMLDIANYREKREETLSSTARRLANKVAKSGRYLKLEPMNAVERRIIHTALQNDDRVTTLSKGSEPKRCVIIFPKEYKE